MMSMSWHEEEVEWQLGAVLRIKVSGHQELERISRWLLTIERPEGLADAEFARFKGDATKYLIRDGVLYRRSGKGVPPGKVILRSGEKQGILERLHDESGHRGRDFTYNKIKNRFYLKGLYTDVDRFVQSCERC